MHVLLCLCPGLKKKETYFLTNPLCNACSIVYLPCFLDSNALLYRQKAYMAHSVKSSTVCLRWYKKFHRLRCQHTHPRILTYPLKGRLQPVTMTAAVGSSRPIHQFPFGCDVNVPITIKGAHCLLHFTLHLRVMDSEASTPAAPGERGRQRKYDLDE